MTWKTPSFNYPPWAGKALIIMAGVILTINIITPVPNYKVLALFLGITGIVDIIITHRIMPVAIAIICALSTVLIAGIPNINYTADPQLQSMMASTMQGLTKILILITVILIGGAIILSKKYGEQMQNNLDKTIPKIKLNKSQVQSGEILHPDVYLCKNKRGQKVELQGKDRYLHTLLIGSTGTGKTSAVLAPMVWQDLQNYHKGNPLGVIVVAPDHEFIDQVREWSNQLGLPCEVVDLDDPYSSKFNPLEGETTIVAEIMRTVLRSTFGEQDAFFGQAQELHAKNTMLLLKQLRGDHITLLDVYQALMDIEGMQNLVDQYEERYGEDVITEYFKKEAFGRNKDKLHQFAMGLRLQISDLLTNEIIYNILVARSDINLDKQMREGGVLLFNTALGKMGHMSRVFGQFLIMHIQNAVFRRPGNEFTRIPQYLYIDELPVYFNPELQNLLNMGRKYRCACTFTIQGPAQLEQGRNGVSTRRIITNGCRNKIVIGIEDADDASLIAKMFGQKEMIETREHRKRFALFPDSYADTHKMMERFDYTHVLELDPWHGLVKICENGRNLEPIEGVFEEPWLFQDRINRTLQKVPKHHILWDA